MPLIVFAFSWGSYLAGMLPEGLQTWVVTLFAVAAIQPRFAGFPWLRSQPIRALLSLRAAELLAMALVPTVATRRLLLSEKYGVIDSIALAGMVAFAATLAALAWIKGGELAHDSHPQASAGEAP